MKIATIGTGNIVEWFMGAAVQIEGADLYAVYSRKLETGKKLAEKFNVANVYTDMDEMLANPEIDCIYIASPNSLHFEQSKQALLANKHVICEKPFTSTLKQVDELIALAKEKNLCLFEAIVTIHMPNYLSIKENIKKLGDIRMVQCNFSQYSSKYDNFVAGETPNVFNPAFSGGALSDINIYNLHFVMNLFGKPKDVHYSATIQRGIDTSGVLLLTYDTFQAVCVGCKDTRSQNISQIQGEKGFITLNSETSRCANYTMTIQGESSNPSIKQNDIALYYELIDFVDIIQKNDTKTCYQLLDYSREVIEVYETARKKANIHFASDEN